jgi:hypothetical protein
MSRCRGLKSVGHRYANRPRRGPCIPCSLVTHHDADQPFDLRTQMRIILWRKHGPSGAPSPSTSWSRREQVCRKRRGRTGPHATTPLSWESSRSPSHSARVDRPLQVRLIAPQGAPKNGFLVVPGPAAGLSLACRQYQAPPQGPDARRADDMEFKLSSFSSIAPPHLFA